LISKPIPGLCLKAEKDIGLYSYNIHYNKLLSPGFAIVRQKLNNAKPLCQFLTISRVKPDPFLSGKKSLHLKKPCLSASNLNKRSGIHGAADNPH